MSPYGWQDGLLLPFILIVLDLPVGAGRSPALWPPPPQPAVRLVSPLPTRSGTVCPCTRTPGNGEPRSRGWQKHNTSPLGDISLPSQRQFKQKRRSKWCDPKSIGLKVGIAKSSFLPQEAAVSSEGEQWNCAVPRRRANMKGRADVCPIGGGGEGGR